MPKKSDRAACQRCLRRVSIDELHVNNFDELLCEQCEPDFRYADRRRDRAAARGSVLVSESERVTIRRDELEALRAVVGAAEKARAEMSSGGWMRSGPDSVDEIWQALGELYRVRPALRPSGVP